MKVTIHSLDDLNIFTKQFIQGLKPGVLVVLDGDLGVGKTTFVKMCAKHLGIEDNVDSPTFTLLKTYFPPLMHHIDAYRLEGSEDIFDIEDAVEDKEAYIFLEWGDYIKPFLPKTYIHIQFDLVNTLERSLIITSKGDIDVESFFNY
jgi:tRNA threonylcarbamoyladenosine biosynthesis protein TsaE